MTAEMWGVRFAKIEACMAGSSIGRLKGLVWRLLRCGSV